MIICSLPLTSKLISERTKVTLQTLQPYPDATYGGVQTVEAAVYHIELLHHESVDVGDISPVLLM